MSDASREVPKVILPALEQIKRVHIVGVCGTLMGAFAAYLKRAGLEVSGSDQNVYPPMSDVLSRAEIKVFEGFRAENITAQTHRPDLVVIGNVITPANLEAQAAIRGGYAFTSLPEAMEKLFLEKTRNYVVAGTHGKTTTSSLLAYTLKHCGLDPSYFIGGVSHDLPESFHVSMLNSGTPFVLEGDEYDTAFWDKVPKFNHYLPDEVILTSIEFDHADIYPDMSAVERAFVGLMARVRKGGNVIACVDYESVRKVIEPRKDGVFRYGASDAHQADAWIENLGSSANGGARGNFVFKSGERVAFELQLPGMHNALNALAAFVQARRAGAETDKVLHAFKTFQGVKRRQEARGEVRGVLVIDDFAHHPTAVRETLKALALKYPGRRLVAVFEPRSATSRRKVFQGDYVEAFSLVPSVWIATPYDQSKIPSGDQFSSHQLVEDLIAKGCQATEFASVDEGVNALARASKAGDVIAVLSNGGFGGFISKLLAELEAALKT